MIKMEYLLSIPRSLFWNIVLFGWGGGKTSLIDC